MTEQLNNNNKSEPKSTAFLMKTGYPTKNNQHRKFQFPDQELNLAGPPALEAQILSHWTTREVSQIHFEMCLSAGKFKTKPLLGKNRGKPGQCPSSWQRAKGRVNSKIQKGGMGKIKGNIG